MLNILSILTGLVAVIFVIPGLIPLLGIFNYIAIPIAAIGLLMGVLSSSNSGRNFNIAILIIAVVRLSLGGGIL